MGANPFSNFDVLIERTDTGFSVRVSAPPWGEAGPLSFAAPFSPQELSSLFSKFGRPLSGVVRDASSPSDLAREFGRRLFQTVFAVDIKSFYSTCQQLALNQNVGLRIRLRLKDVPELADAPWELLHDGTDFVALQPQRALVRYLELPQPIVPLAADLPLRVLVITSSPRDYDALDVEREWHLLNDAIAESANPGLVEIVRLPRASLADLQPQLRAKPYHILHFSGHGEFDNSAQDDLKGALVFTREDGRGQSVDAIALARLLREQPSLRLVVLNACEGARASTRNAFAGAAQTLIRQGIPAVLAMQFALTDEAASVLAQTLYGALADGFPIDAALHEARLAIVAQQESLEWATPVLFMRAGDGQLFQLAALDDTKRREMNSARLDELGRDALRQGDFDHASAFAARLRALDLKDARGLILDERAQRERDVAKWYAEGKDDFDAGKNEEALAALRRVQTIHYSYRDTVDLIQSATRALPAQNGERGLAAEAPDTYELHYKNIAKELLRGRILPFFGQSVNAFGRSTAEDWQRVHGLPNAEELARYLADNFDYDLPDRTDLIRVSQYIAVMKGGNTELFEELHSVFTAQDAPTPLHRFWAELPALLRARGVLPQPGEPPPPGEGAPFPILFTANYDDLLERAFRDADEPFDLLIYLAEGEDRGKFLHRTFEGKETLVISPSDYPNMRLDQRSTIVKVYGAIDRTQPERDSLVITEDHYLEYLKESVRDLLPMTVNMQITRAYVLFMGCNLRNWALRGALYRLGKSNRRPWVIQPNAREVDIKYWNMLNVELLNLSMEEFLPKLAARLTVTSGSNGGRAQ